MWGEISSLPVEEQFWARWGYVYHRWGTLPYAGGALQQPWIFWYFVDLISYVQQKKEKMKDFNDEIKRIDFKLEY